MGGIKDETFATAGRLNRLIRRIDGTRALMQATGYS